MRAAALVVVLAACGRVGFDPIGDGNSLTNASVPQWQSGTRLRANVVDFGNGARELLNWHDIQLDADCTIKVTADGEQRCVPGYPSTQQAIVWYTDTSCSQAVGAWYTLNGNLPPLAVDYVDIGCDEATRLRMVGAEIAPTQFYSWTSTPTGRQCTGPTAPPAGYKFYALGPETDYTQFVRVVDSRVGTGALKASGWLADDGAFERSQLYDGVNHTLCAITDTAAGKRCIPAQSAPVISFADSACTQQLVVDFGSCTRKYSVQSEGFCGISHVFPVGGSFPSTTAYAKVGTTCQSYTTTVPLRTIDPEIDPTTFSSGFIDQRPLGGRLAEQTWRSMDGTVAHQSWFDTTRSERCHYGADGMGGARCFPVDFANSIQFSDAACTVPIAEQFPGCPVRPYVFQSDDRGLVIHAIDNAAQQPTQAFGYFVGMCQSGIFDATRTYMTGGAVVPLSEFLPGTTGLE